MEEPNPVDSKTARQLFICGQIMGAEMRLRSHQYVDKEAIPGMLDQVDVDLLEAYLKTPAKGFRYADEVQHVIDIAKKHKESVTQRETAP